MGKIGQFAAHSGNNQRNYPVDHRSTSQLGLSFNCSRTTPRSQHIKTVYQNAIKGAAHLGFDQHGACQMVQGIQMCSPNQRGNLYECGCTTLNRLTDEGRDARLKFENQVIAQALSLVNQSRSIPFHLRLGFFCSGGLFGEQVLLFRLANELKKRGFRGNIELFLIDKCYDRLLDSSVAITPNNKHSGPAVKQFLNELNGGLPKQITVSGVFFKDSNDYIRLAERDDRYKHDLFVGADIEKASPFLQEIGMKAGVHGIAPLALIKEGPDLGKPRVCKMKINYQDCFDPANPHQTFQIPYPVATMQEQSVKENESNRQYLVILGIILVAAVALGVVAWAATRKRQK